MARMSVGASFISKQAHMITYSDEVFQRWLEIVQRLENYNKKPGATSFCYLCGLEEDEVVGIQEEIENGKILLSKGAKEANMMDMADRIKQLKQDRIIQDALLIEFNKFDIENPCKDWEELANKYNINNVVYSQFLKLCDTWLTSHLKRGTKKVEFLEEAIKYIEWTINLAREKVDSINLPWCVCVVNLQMEERTYLQRHFNSPISIGLSVLDLTTRLHTSPQWSAKRFLDLLNGILAISKESRKEEYAFVAFLGNTDHIQLQCALESMQEVVKNHFVGALHFKKDLEFVGAIEFFTTLVLFEKEHAV